MERGPLEDGDAQLVGYRALVWSGARAEAALLRDLLGAPVAVPPARYGAKGYLGRIRGIAGDAALWREQGYLFLRLLVGFVLAAAAASVVGAGLWLVAAPVAYRWAPLDFGARRVDTLGEALALVPAGIVVLALSPLLVLGGARIWPPLARTLLAGGEARPPRDSTPVALGLRRALPVHAAFSAGLNLLLVVVWAFTGRGYFWPEWTLLPLALLLGIHACAVLVRRPLAVHAGTWLAVWLFLVCVWAVTTRGYFWPMWPLLGAAALLGGHPLAVFAGGRDRRRPTERIEVLTETRSGAVDAAEAELRRIERDLHDGAQARLVALGMSLGLAEQKLRTDPDAALTLLAEARADAGEALRELRDLAHGIHPPILADRGLEAALGALASRGPLRVDVRVDVPDRRSDPRRGGDPLRVVIAEDLALLRDGLTRLLRDNGIAQALVLTVGAVEKHVASILSKLDLPPSDSGHRRVLAVLEYLNSTVG